MKQMSYEQARSKMLPGDVIAFGGKGHISAGIKLFTRSAVSHVGVILHRTIVGGGPSGYFNEIIESTSLNGSTGVQVNRMSDRIENSGGCDVWWLPLSQESRGRLNAGAFFGFLMSQKDKPYDYLQAAGSAVDLCGPLGWLGANREDFDRFFCSELVAAGLEAGGVLPPINSSEVTPIDLCRFAIYGDCVQLLGQPRGISRFNTIRNLDDW